MRIQIGTLAFMLLSSQSHATSLYDQLVAFNPYWEHHRMALDGIETKRINNDVDYVRAHLAQVRDVLSDAPTSHLTDEQLASREELITVLGDYARNGLFPINYYRHERIPVFIDEHDTHCAVGHLMRHTGEEAMARRIAAANNYAWVREINDTGLAVWQVASGFSLEELKLIQGAYDFYIQDAFLLPDKYEVPQKPEQVVRYFEGKDASTSLGTSAKVWCFGEGSNGDLHGRWEQNYSSTLPWIVGYFEHGKRSGRWKEFYKGTEKLCRTEHWRDDKLNGMRTRYDRDGRVIETILFKNGQAIIKTNIDHEKALRWVRRPIDSLTVQTEVFTEEGGLIAVGKERIHNPEGLMWFQNIELTALNTYAISARDGAPRPENGVFVPRFDLNGNGHGQQIPGSHTLVEYKKEGEWVYYKDYLHPEHTVGSVPSDDETPSGAEVFTLGYMHFGADLFRNIAGYDHLELTASYDSMHVVYRDDRMVDLFGHRSVEQDHLHLTYHPSALRFIGFPGSRRSDHGELVGPIKQIARSDAQGNLVGVRVDYDPRGRVMREEHFYVPYKKEEEALGVVD